MIDSIDLQCLGILIFLPWIVLILFESLGSDSPKKTHDTLGEELGVSHNDLLPWFTSGFE